MLLTAGRLRGGAAADRAPPPPALVERPRLAADESWRDPLLLNAVLCDLRMNPEEQRAPATGANRRGPPLRARQPCALRRAQLLGCAATTARARSSSSCAGSSRTGAFRAEPRRFGARRRQARDGRLLADRRAQDDAGGGGGGMRGRRRRWRRRRRRRRRRRMVARPRRPVLAALLAALCQWILPCGGLAPLSLRRQRVHAQRRACYGAWRCRAACQAGGDRAGASSRRAGRVPAPGHTGVGIFCIGAVTLKSE